MSVKNILLELNDDQRDAVIHLDSHAYTKTLGYLYSAEYKLLMNTKNKRNLSKKVLAWKKKINWRILNESIVSRTIIIT